MIANTTDMESDTTSGEISMKEIGNSKEETLCLTRRSNWSTLNLSDDHHVHELSGSPVVGLRFGKKVSLTYKCTA